MEVVQTAKEVEELESKYEWDETSMRILLIDPTEEGDRGMQAKAVTLLFERLKLHKARVVMIVFSVTIHHFYF